MRVKPTVHAALGTCHCCGKYMRIVIIIKDGVGIAVCPRCDIIHPVVEEVGT